jgi:hypothetical protein
LSDKNLHETVEAQGRQIEDLNRRLEASERLGILDVAIFHPFKHFAKPGVGNKAEAGVGIAGRAAIGYGLYRGGKWVVGKIFGG